MLDLLSHHMLSRKLCTGDCASGLGMHNALLDLSIV